MHYVVGLILIAVGAGIIVKTEWVLENFGINTWAENKFGTSGGSRFFYKLLGIVVIVVGFMVITDLFQGFLFATIGKLFIRS